MAGTQWIIGAFVLAGVVAAAAAPAAFEAASVKRYAPQLRPGILAVTRSDPGPSRFVVSGTRVSAVGNLLALVRLSYDLEASHVRLSPELADKWVTSEVYEIDARAPGNETPSLSQVREMTQTLLAERFQLRVTRGNEVMPVYNLVIAPGGPKLKPTAFADSAPQTRDQGSAGAHLRMRQLNFSMSDLVDAVRRQLDRPLLDKTGLSGGFDFTLDYEAQRPGEMPSDTGAAPELVTALREQLGLAVVPAREPVEILTIERAQRPSEN